MNVVDIFLISVCLFLIGFGYMIRVVIEFIKGDDNETGDD